MVLTLLNFMIISDLDIRKLNYSYKDVDISIVLLEDMKPQFKGLPVCLVEVRTNGLPV